MVFDAVQELPFQQLTNMKYQTLNVDDQSISIKPMLKEINRPSIGFFSRSIHQISFFSELE